MRVALALLVLGLAAACDDGRDVPAQPSTGRTRDAGTRADAGEGDAGARDAAPRDAAILDATARDASAPDAAPRDATAPDAAPRDASAPDASAALEDAGPPCTEVAARDYPAEALVGTAMRAGTGGLVLAGWGVPAGTTQNAASSWIAEVAWDGTPSSERWIGDGNAVRAIEGIALAPTVIVGSTGSGFSDGWFSRVTSAGQLVDERAFGSGGQDVIQAVEPLPGGGYVLAGYEGTSADAFWLLTTDASGTPAWNRRYPGGEWDIAYDVVVLPNGFVAAGRRRNQGPDIDARVVRVAVNGNVIWDVRHAGSGWDEARAIELLSGGDLVVSGYSGPDAWVFRLDAATGRILWARTFPPRGRDLQLWALAVLPGDRILVAGSAWADSTNGVDWWMLDAAGNTLVDRQHFGATEHVADAAPIPGGFALFGGHHMGTGFRGGGWLRTFRCTEPR